MSKWLICGSRNVNSSLQSYTNELLDKVIIFMGWPSAICHGGATGFDTLADKWARSNGYSPQTGTLKIYNANWKRYGKAAGTIRNKHMLEDFKPTLIISFPGGSGTLNMKNLAKKAGIPVLEAPISTILAHSPDKKIAATKRLKNRDVALKIETLSS